MNASRISGDRWRGMLNDEWHVDQPSWDEAEDAIRRLDASTYTIVMIESIGEQHLAVGGGAGRYVVYATFDNYDFWNLLGDGGAGGRTLLNAGGQDGDYPVRQIVDLEQACRAARTFFLGLRLDPSLWWEKQ
jgi:hypothetical protein